MPKDYLNNDEQELLWMMGAVNYTCEEMIETLEEKAPDKKDLIKFLKYIRTYSAKTMDNLTSGLSQELIEDYIGKLNRREVSLVVQNNTKKQAQEMENTVVLEKEKFFDLVDVVLSNECQGCDNDEVCELRDMLIRKNVPFFDSEDEVCPYRQKL